MISIILLVILAAVTWCVASEGPWGAMMIFFATLFGGLFAFNYFEPAAVSIQGILPATWSVHADFIALMLIFTLVVFLVRLGTLYLLSSYVEVHPAVYEGGRWFFGVATGYLAVAILLASIHTAPLPREFLQFSPEGKNFFGIVAPDRQWLGFMHYVSENNLARYGEKRIFDGHQDSSVIGVENKTWPSFPIRYATRRYEYSRNIGVEYVDGGGRSEGGGWDQQDPKSATTGEGHTKDKTGKSVKQIDF